MNKKQSEPVKPQPPYKSRDVDFSFYENEFIDIHHLMGDRFRLSDLEQYVPKDINREDVSIYIDVTCECNDYYGDSKEWEATLSFPLNERMLKEKKDSVASEKSKAQLQYEEELAVYKAKMKTYRQEKKEWDKKVLAERIEADMKKLKKLNGK